MATKSIKIDTIAKRAVLAAAMLICLLGIVYFMRWCAGNSIALNTIFAEAADTAVSLAPDDPQTHYTIAVLSERVFSDENVSKSIAEYERATALTPNDFRTWLALGKAREHGDDAAGAEKALRKALELAPNYSEVRWILGNVLLRRGKTDEAFAELRRAAETSADFASPTVSTAWQMFDGDLEKINRYLGDAPTVKSALVAYLMRAKRFDEAVQIWNTLSADDKRATFRVNSDALFNQLTQAKKYRAALQITTQLNDFSPEKPAVGRIYNGSFEDDVKTSGANFFAWQIQDGAQPQIGVDASQKHGGGHSLTVVFNSVAGRDFRSVSQTIAVESGAKYAFQSFYKSQLKTAATLRWEIADAADGRILAQTAPVDAASDWTNLKTEFVVPANSEAVVVRLAREVCKTTLCPISGRVWFDDLSISQ
jgi:tetratricopeptide (TPR) repeat protein